MSSSLVKQVKGNQRRSPKEPPDLYKEKLKSLKKNNDLLAKKLEKTAYELATYKSLSIKLNEFMIYMKDIKFKMTDLRAILQSSVLKCDEILPMLCLDAFEWQPSVPYSRSNSRAVDDMTKVAQQESGVDNYIPTSSNAVHGKNAASDVQRVHQDYVKKSAQTHSMPDLKGMKAGAAEKETSVAKNPVLFKHDEAAKSSSLPPITASKNSGKDLKKNAEQAKSALIQKSILKSKKAPLIPQLPTASEESNDTAPDFRSGNSDCRRQTFVVPKSNSRKTFVVKPTDMSFEEPFEASDSTNEQMSVVPEGKNSGVSKSDLPAIVVRIPKKLNDLEEISNKEDACTNEKHSLNDNQIKTDNQISNLELKSVDNIASNSDGKHSSNKNKDELKAAANLLPTNKTLMAGNCIKDDSNLFHLPSMTDALCESDEQNEDKHTANNNSDIHNSISDLGGLSLRSETERLLSGKDDYTLPIDTTPIRGQISGTKKRVFVFRSPEKKCKPENKPNTSKIPKKVDAKKDVLNLPKNAATDVERKNETEISALPVEKHASVSTELNSDISNQPLQDPFKLPESSQAPLNELSSASGIDGADVALTASHKPKASRRQTLKRSHKIKELSPPTNIGTGGKSPVKNDDDTSADREGETETLPPAGKECIISTEVHSNISKQPVLDQCKLPEFSQAPLSELICASDMDQIDVALTVPSKPKASRVTKTLKRSHKIKKHSPPSNIATDEKSPVKTDVASAEKEDGAKTLTEKKDIIVSADVDSNQNHQNQPAESSQEPANDINQLNAAFCTTVTPCKPKPSRITKKLKKNRKFSKLSPILSIRADADIISSERCSGTENLALSGEQHEIISDKVDSDVPDQPMQDQVMPLNHSEAPLDALITVCKSNVPQTTKTVKGRHKINELPSVKTSKKRPASSVHDEVSHPHSKNPSGDKVKRKKRQPDCKKIGGNKLVVYAEIHPVPPSPNLRDADKENQASLYQPTVVLTDVLKSKTAELFNTEPVRESARLPLSVISHGASSEENIKKKSEDQIIEVEEQLAVDEVQVIEEFPSRQRRARRQVNYKELPLTVKMRR